MQSERLMRPTDTQLELFKATFATNLEFLKTIRKVFLQLPLEQNEKDSLQYLLKDNTDLLEALRMMFLPELDGDMPLGQNMDLWMTLDISNRLPEDAHLHLKSRKLLIDMLEAGLSELTDPQESDKYQFKLTDDSEEDFINVIARNTFVSHIDQVLNQIKFLAGKKSETVEETKTRLAKDSTK